MQFERFARSDEVKGPRFIRRESDGRAVLLTRLEDGTPVAFGPICPHQSRPMDDGSLWEGEIDCPHHHYTYDPRTGENRFPKRIFPAHRAASVRPIAVFEVREADGWVLVGPQRPPPGADDRG
jgi:nitrite reductase/ring-hydroxylating ferredoxin subunit